MNIGEAVVTSTTTSVGSTLRVAIDREVELDDRGQPRMVTATAYLGRAEVAEMRDACDEFLLGRAVR